MSELDNSMTALPWQIEALRFTFLQTTGSQAEQEFCLSSITSAQPESVTSKPNLGLITEEGPWLQGTLSIAKQFGKIDIVYGFKPDTESILPDAGKFSDILSAASQIIEATKHIGASRIGFGGVLLLPVEKAEDGYKFLKKFLPFINISDDMSEVFFQVNRRKKSATGLVINELTKWSCIALRKLMFSGDSVSSEPVDVHATRLEFDINNADHNEMLNDGSEKLLRELIERSKRISRDGAS